MNIERLTPTELPSDALALLQQSTLLGSPQFLKLWETAGGVVVVWCAIEAGRTIAMLPGVEFRGKPFTRFQSMPDGLYLRLVRADESRSNPEIQENLIQAIQRHSYALCFLVDYFRELGETVRLDVAMHKTDLVELTPGWEPPDSTLRSEIRKGEREGGAVERFDSPRHLAGFLSLMKATESRHGRPPKYADSFFESLARLAETDHRIHWYYMESEGKPVVSQIYLIEGETALNWQIYFDKQFSGLKANQLMMYTAARKLQESGVRFLNLGATPEGAESVQTYKEKWGGKSVAYPCYQAKSWLGRIF